MTVKFVYCTKRSYYLFYPSSIYSDCRKQLNSHVQICTNSANSLGHRCPGDFPFFFISRLFFCCSGAVAPQVVPQPHNQSCLPSSPECRKVPHCPSLQCSNRKVDISWACHTGHHCFCKNSQSHVQYQSTAE